ncbi:serine hydrolase [Actinomadura alba]|uniref:Serine hydrolase n=1 Tax=Actinomadura alba TaxID=406431 RepID=A0ABR7LJ72_9ACTN|nr:serine hydrolase [Actinomadura alba]MBC6464843.1 serine hydrolase [Actinomadura alba]
MGQGIRMNRRTALLGVSGMAISAVVTGRTAHSASAAAPAPAPARGDAALRDFLAFLSGHRANAGLVSYAVGRDGLPLTDRPYVWHRAGALFPVASAVKTLHLDAYAAARRIGPRQRVRLGDWEAYLLPGTDGGAHERALTALGLAVKDGRAADPNATVPFDDVVATMIEHSDNAAADFVRHRVGPDALVAAARKASGMRISPVPSLLGQMLVAFASDSPYRGMDGLRRLAALPAARRYELAGIQERRHLAGAAAPMTVPGLEEQSAWAETTYGMAPRLLAALLAGALTGRGEQAALVRRHLEWPMRLGGTLPDGLIRLGGKGGSFPGVLSDATYTVAADGTRRVTALTLRRLAVSDWISLMTSFAHQQMIVRMGTDPAFVDEVARAVTG